jgi:hypothetical protein
MVLITTMSSPDDVYVERVDMCHRRARNEITLNALVEPSGLVDHQVLIRPSFSLAPSTSPVQ